MFSKKGLILPQTKSIMNKTEIKHKNGFVLTVETTGFTDLNCYIGLEDWAETDKHLKALTLIDNLYIRMGVKETQVEEINQILSLVPRRVFFDDFATASQACKHYGDGYSVRKITTHIGSVIVVCTGEQFRAGIIREKIKTLLKQKS